MDRYGNLTSQAEFSGGRRIRIISYLGQDLAIGTDGRIVRGFSIFPAVQGGVSLHHLSSGDPERTVFVAQATRGGFTLARGVDPTLLLNWEGEGRSIGVASSRFGGFDDPTFIVEFVDGCWFNLRSADGSLVVDCAGSGTAEGQAILAWEGNGGDNQKWRAEAA